MNKKEVLELRKQFKPEDCSITRICGCYVDGEKEIKSQTKDAFLSLPEEEIFKYLNIFKQTLSGTIGKNLLNMEFPLEQELSGGTQEFLLQLRDSKLQDDMLIEEFYQKIIENYNYGENYYIILIHVAYDIPGNLLMELRCSMLQMKFLNMCFAVSVRFTFPKKDFATILRRTMSKTGFVTGLSNHR